MLSSQKFPITLFLIVFVGMICTFIFLYTKRVTQPTIQTANIVSQNNITPSPTSTLPQGNSNQQLNQDNQSIDDSFNSLDADLHSVDQSLNDQSTNLQ